MHLKEMLAKFRAKALTKHEHLHERLPHLKAVKERNLAKKERKAMLKLDKLNNKLNRFRAKQEREVTKLL